MTEATEQESKYLDRYSVSDLVQMAIIAAIFGAIAIYNMVILEFLRLGALGLYGGMLVGGLFNVPGIMAYGLIRKKGVAFITQNLFGFAQLLFGNPIGFVVLWFTFAEAVGQELVFALFRYRRAGDWRVWAVAGIASAIGAQIPNYIIYGFGGMPLWSWLLPLLVTGIPSAIILPIILTKAVLRIVPSTAVNE